ncbi:MAG: hypothetical protein QW561_00510 [Candidatus Aenigmatarchaeota archaeon]
MAEEKYKVKVGDEEIEVTLDELMKGYLRQSDYTKKTQALAEERKKLENELREIENLRAEAERAAQWDQWYEQNRAFIEGRGNTAYSMDVEDTDSDALRKEIKRLSEEIKSLVESGKREIEAIKAENARLERALRYSWYLEDLKDKHLRNYPDIPFDKRKIIDMAFEYGKADLSDKDWDAIYNRAYHEEFLKREVDRRLAERLKTEEEKGKAAKMAGAGEGSPRVFELPKKVPESMEEAAEGALRILGQRKSE